MTKRGMKICSTPLVTGEMQVKTSRRNDCVPQKWQKSTGSRSRTSWKMHVARAGDASLAEAGQSGRYVMMGLAASAEVWKVVSSAASGVLLDIYLSGTQKPCSQAEMSKDRSTVGYL